LGQGRFVAPTATGAFSIAGGMVRLNNFIVEGDGARLTGDLTLDLGSLGLGGDFALTPVGFDAADGSIGSETARIFTRLGGSLLAPAAQPGLDEMGAAIQVRSNELEVDRLEAFAR
ncbi:MAG: hypothetical protein MO852_11580, partial [Candidatus Devosia euplotis]|nr:hypothetical protein [Candidatus Devosia euplotis]